MKTSAEQKPGAADLFGTKEVLQLVVKKLASQSLSFGLAIALVLVGAWNLSRNSLPIVIALLFVFTLALAGYLFVEQQGKLQRQDPVALNHLMEEKMKRINVLTPPPEQDSRRWEADKESSKSQIPPIPRERQKPGSANAPTATFCIHCGVRNGPDNLFCINCGRRIR